MLGSIKLFNLVHFYCNVYTKQGKWATTYLRVRGINFAFFCDCNIRFWNCADCVITLLSFILFLNLDCMNWRQKYKMRTSSSFLGNVRFRCHHTKFLRKRFVLYLLVCVAIICYLFDFIYPFVIKEKMQHVIN
jgi:hypothetical protein